MGELQPVSSANQLQVFSISPCFPLPFSLSRLRWDTLRVFSTCLGGIISRHWQTQPVLMLQPVGEMGDPQVHSSPLWWQGLQLYSPTKEPQLRDKTMMLPHSGQEGCSRNKMEGVKLVVLLLQSHSVVKCWPGRRRIKRDGKRVQETDFHCGVNSGRWRRVPAFHSPEDSGGKASYNSAARCWQPLACFQHEVH